MTVYYRLDAANLDMEIINNAGALLRRGELVAFPTETVYGLGADALNPEAVKRIFAAKGRRPDNPLIVHVSSIEQVEELVDGIPSEARLLMERFWPGPLTLVMRALSRVPDEVRAGGETVGVRMPDHPVARALIQLVGPLAAPSANLSGRPSPTTAKHVKKDLDGRIAAVLDAGAAGLGIESTVLQVTSKPFRIIRPGGITREQLLSALPADIGLEDSEVRADRYPHYQTRAQVVVISGPGELEELSHRYGGKGKSTGFVVHKPNGYRHILDEVDKVYQLEGDPELAVRSLYEILRDVDRLNIDVLWFESYPEQGMGAVLMDRVRKAGRRE
ncbi:MAG: L-threonylcarbamoyladenylate synthase [Syntrophothermaceae bacterium]